VEKIITFQSESIVEVLFTIQKSLQNCELLKVRVIEDPNAIEISTWCEIAEYFDCRLKLQKIDNSDSLCFILDKMKLLSFEHKDESEKYGEGSEYTLINKLKEPWFIMDMLAALEFLMPQKNDTIIDLGSNKGDLFSIFSIWNQELSNSFHYIGLDHSQSAIEQANNSFPENNFKFICNKLDNYPKEKIPSFDLLMSVGTLQSTNLEGKDVFKNFFQHGMKKNGKVLLAFPNCRYAKEGVMYGARTKNFKGRDYSLVLKDCMYYKKYLQQHGYRVWVYGKYYLFLAARKIN
jgi:hypothetical protein